MFKMVPTDDTNTLPTTSLVVHPYLGCMMKLLYLLLDGAKFDFCSYSYILNPYNLKTHSSVFIDLENKIVGP